MELGATAVPSAASRTAAPAHGAGLCDAAREGDAALLPVHEKKRPPRRVDVAVCLLTWKRRVLVTRRGMNACWAACTCSGLLEDETQPGARRGPVA